MSLSAQIKQLALDAGFEVAGIAPIDAQRDLEFAQAWTDRGCGGEMGYLKNPKRADPRLVLPPARSVVCVGMVYNTALPYSTEVSSQQSAFSYEPPRGQPADDKSQAASGGSRIRDGVPGTKDRRGPAEPRAWISRYAWGRDYHRVMRARLEQLRAALHQLGRGIETRVYVDTGPIVERAFARLSGIGWVGKNTCLINQERGSWLFLGVILTSLALEPDTPAFDRCGSCRRCLEACPTGALTEPYVMDASRCIAYFNIELKGSIPEPYRSAIGANLFGCDICQDVCPWNHPSSLAGVLSSSDQHPTFEALSSPSFAAGEPTRARPPDSAPDGRRQRAAVTSIAEFQPLEFTLQAKPNAAPAHTPHELSAGDETPARKPRTFSLFNPRLEDLASMSEDDFRRVFRHSPIKRAKYRGWLRNLCVVMGNSGDARFVPWLERMRAEGDLVVREHAGWALAMLRSSSNRGRSSGESSGPTV